MIKDEKYLQKIATNLRKARIASKKTQEDLSFDTDISRQYISELENGHNNPSIVALKKICNALGIKVGDIAD